jgi:hypothetical protein
MNMYVAKGKLSQLFETQDQWNRFNRSMSSIFGTEYTPSVKPYDMGDSYERLFRPKPPKPKFDIESYDFDPPDTSEPVIITGSSLKRLNTRDSVLALKNPRIFDLAALGIVSAGPSKSARKRRRPGPSPIYRHLD